MSWRISEEAGDNGTYEEIVTVLLGRTRSGQL